MSKVSVVQFDYCSLKTNWQSRQSEESRTCAANRNHPKSVWEIGGIKRKINQQQPTSSSIETQLQTSILYVYVTLGKALC